MVNEQAFTLSQPQPTVFLPQPQPTLPTLGELAQRFWRELLQGASPANGNDVDPRNVGERPGGWR